MRNDNDKIYTLVVKKRVEVSEAVYRAYYKEREHEKYLEEKVRDNEYSFEGMEEKGINFEFNNGLSGISPEERLLRELKLQSLYDALAELLPSERKLIKDIYYEGKTERLLAESLGISQVAVNLRKKKILSKLRTLLEE